MLSDDGADTVDSRFAGLFGEPFVSVNVFRGTYGHFQIVGVSAPVRNDIQYDRPGPFCRVICQPAFHEVPCAVSYGNFIACAVSEHFYAMLGFFPVKIQPSVRYV